MNSKQIMNIFSDTAYVRMGGSDTEKRCAQYLRKCCRTIGADAVSECFEVEMATVKSAHLYIDGKEIACKGYLCAKSGEIDAPLYYLANTDPYSLSLCKDKIVMIDGYLGYWIYQDIFENGALGFITYDGNVNYTDRDIDQRELRSYVSNGRKLPGVNINAKDAVNLIQSGASRARILLEQEEYKGESQNVIMDLPGEIPETIILSAHYDSTSLSNGAYDNMSGCIGLLGIAEYFLSHPHRYSLRFIFCGSEERGLLGSKAYTAAHEAELPKTVLNVNLDMIGCTMGKFIACCSAEQKLVDYITYMASEKGFGISAKQDVYSSDSSPFADKGVPSLSFARIAPNNTATIHNSYDTQAIISPEQMIADIDFITAFVERMACAARCPVAREIPANVKDKLDIYFYRKRAQK